MSYSLPISPAYRRPVFEALVIQALFGGFSLLVLDGGNLARICGIALLAFWAGAAVRIWRRPQAPSPADLEWIRFGYLPVAMVAFILVHFMWNWKGLE